MYQIKNKTKQKVWSMIRPSIRKNNKNCQSMMSRSFLFEYKSKKKSSTKKVKKKEKK